MGRGAGRGRIRFWVALGCGRIEHRDKHLAAVDGRLRCDEHPGDDEDRPQQNAEGDGVDQRLDGNGGRQRQHGDGHGGLELAQGVEVH